METTVIVVGVLGCIYLLVGTFFMWLNAYEIYHARSNTKDRFWFALRCGLAWPWVKTSQKGEE